jgi:crossover junction endodeoxyribonuclease RuvC
MRIIGIDPGADGALVSLGENSCMLRKMPNNENDLVLTIEELWKRTAAHHVFLEKAQVMPGNGAVGMFRYGDGFGQIKGILAALRIPHTLVHPKTWTRIMHHGTAIGHPKARSLEAVRRLFPQIELRRTERCRNLDEGFIDALLIAEYGRRFLNGHLETRHSEN